MTRRSVTTRTAVVGPLTALVLTVTAPAAMPVPAPTEEPPEFTAVTRPLTGIERRAMKPSVWRRGCPVPLRRLRVIEATHWTFAGMVDSGKLVVHADVAESVEGLLAGFFAAGFPIRRMRPIQRYGGDDFASIEADNTSAFNCRFVDGTHRWSRHAFGRAIDINPLENPYVSRGHTSHRASTAYVRRSPVRTGMLAEDTAALAVIDQAGWGWGGRWRGAKDYQHVSADGK